MVEDREQEAQRQRHRAEANFHKAANAIHQMLTRVSEARLPNVPGSEHLRRCIGRCAAAQPRAVAGAKPRAIPAPRDGSGFRQLADVYHNLGQPAQAEKAYGRSLALYKGLVAEFSDRSEYQEELAETHNNLAILLMDTGRPERARTAYEQALTLRKALMDRFPNEPKHRHQQAILQCNLAVLLFKTGHLGEAERIYRKAADLQQDLASRFPAEPTYRYSWSWALMNRGVVLASTGRTTEAERSYQQARPLLEKLARDFPQVAGYRYELAGLHDNLALPFLGKRFDCPGRGALPGRLGLARAVGDPLPQGARLPAPGRQLPEPHRNPDAAPAAAGGGKGRRQALALRQRLAAQFPQVPDYESDLGATLGVLGAIAQAQGKLAEASQRLTQAVSHHGECREAEPAPRDVSPIPAPRLPEPGRGPAEARGARGGSQGCGRSPPDSRGEMARPSPCGELVGRLHQPGRKGPSPGSGEAASAVCSTQNRPSISSGRPLPRGLPTSAT